MSDQTGRKSDDKKATSQPDWVTESISEEKARVAISTPWDGDLSQSVDYQGPRARQSLEEFVDRRSKVHEEHIREQAKNKRLGLALAFVLILGAVAILMFAPSGRQDMSYWIGGALLLFAAGCAGYGRVWGRVERISFGADGGGDNH